MIPLAYLTRYKQQVFLDEEQLSVTDQPLWIEINETFTIFNTCSLHCI